MGDDDTYLEKRTKWKQQKNLWIPHHKKGHREIAFAMPLTSKMW